MHGRDVKIEHDALAISLQYMVHRIRSNPRENTMKFVIRQAMVYWLAAASVITVAQEAKPEPDAVRPEAGESAVESPPRKIELAFTPQLTRTLQRSTRETPRSWSRCGLPRGVHQPHEWRGDCWT